MADEEVPRPRDEELKELFAFYVERLNRGEECHPQEILARHPALGERLLACLERYIGAGEAETGAGRVLGDYTLREEIGRGGMGVVYHAWQNSLDREVALKILPIGIAADDKAFHRFMREAKTAARLNHENIVRVYGMGVESNTPYYAMESVEGSTPVYMSPEQARRRSRIDHRTDIYSLGTTLYEVLALRPPFKGRDHADTLGQILQREPVPVRRFDGGIPRNLETIVLKCLRKSPKDRYPTARALADDLRRFARSEPIEARPLPRWQRGLQWTQRYALRLGAAAMILTLLSFLTFSALQPQDMVGQRVLSSRDINLNYFLDMRPSPDGRRVAYSRYGWDGALMVRDLETGEEVQLTTDEWTYSGEDGPVWSPDGGRIAYSVLETTTLKIVDVQTRTSVTPGGTEGLELEPLDWSPDGKTILCARSGTIRNARSVVSLSLDSGIVKTLVEEEQDPRTDFHPVFSRDGRFIAYTAVEDGDEEVFIVAADGTSRRRITDSPGADRHALWSPSGNELVYENEHGLWSVDIIDGQPQSFPRFLQAASFGRPLVWTMEAGLFYHNDSTEAAFWAVPVDPRSDDPSGAPRPFPMGSVPGALRCAWSPDMASVAYTTNEDGRIRVYSVEDGSQRSIVTGFERVPSSLWWSRDGARLYYVPKGEPISGIFSADPQSGSTEPLFPPMKEASRFHLAPDGQAMLFYRGNEERELVVARTGDREGRVIAAEQEEEVGPFSNWVRPVFSPDGTQILFATFDDDANLWVAAVDGSSRRILATARPVQVSGLPGHVAIVHSAVWHPDGSHVAYEDWQSLFIVNVETGEERKIPLPEEVIGHLDAILQWSPDGKYIALRCSRGGPELRRIRNLLSDRSP